MYSVKPLGINIKDNDRNVKDGFLQESINLQWRDNSFKPIPDRIISDINADGYTNIILHKVSDEDRINVLGFNTGVDPDGLFLAFDLADYLGGGWGGEGGGVLEWFGSIVDGVFQTKTVTQLPLVSSPGMSFTILNGLIYLMGDGSTGYEQYYYRLQFNEVENSYEVHDMYRWKSLIPFYPFQTDVEITAPNNSYQAFI